jgi:uncharacterized protein YcbK (DUF882 family)
VEKSVKITTAIFAAVLFLVMRRHYKKAVNMDKLTEHFNFSEFQSHDGAPMPADVRENIKELAKNLEIIRAAVGRPLKINSGYRSPAWNKKVGGVSGSQHQLGKAADIVAEGMGSTQLHKIVTDLISQGKIKPGGVGHYDTFVHYDIRGYNTRWNG